MKSRGLIAFSVLVVASFFVLSSTGCKKKQPLVVPPPGTTTETSKTAPEEVSYKDFTSIPEIATVYFDYDKYELSEETRKTLQKNADFLKIHPELEVIVEGNCCECGTNEYNLALGQQRAKIVSDYYIKLGIVASKIGTISYGKEKPINVNAGPPDSPLCGVNRRAETKIKTIKLDNLPK